ncbi:TRAP transporter substrate-binding protein [Bacillus dakarensis]|uniref:TRAP transporter substrate-binding protein n=1 Tax=Robertmurraya dakarensis TaxID=1926278 RepID=UPI00098237BC|nr:TRAP transporter substrate-binding protein DctP [Bacillus dakarensis]
MKKRKSFLTLAMGAMLALSACSGGGTTSTDGSSSSSSSSGENVNFRASSGVSDKHFWDRGFFQPLIDRVEEETNGGVTFDKFTAGELVGLGTEYDALRQGTIDVAFTFMAPYDPQRFPYTEVVMLPLLESDAHIAATAMSNMMKSDREIQDGKTYYELEFAEKGLVAFANPPTEPYVLSTTEQTFESVDDFNNKIRMRTASRVHEILSENLGITSLSMPITDAYDSLSRNALDGIFYNIPDWQAFGFDELIKHTIVGANLGHFVGHTAMTQETWDSLPKETQDIFTNAAEELIFNGAELAMSETKLNEESNLEKGGQFTHLDELNPEVSERIQKAMVDTWMDWIENLEGQGIAGKEMAMLWRDMLVEAGAKLPEEIMNLQ